MKSEVPKIALVVALVVVVLVLIGVGGSYVSKASGPEIDRSKPPADFLDPSKAKGPGLRR